MALMKALLRFISRPSVWVGLAAVIAYWDERALKGNWVYDDAGSVLKNVVVNGEVPWKDAFTRDFWGTSMNEITSHKSFRPITTLTFKLNWILNEHFGREGKDTHWFHLFNVPLHGLASGLVTEAAAFVWPDGTDIDIICQILTGTLFAIHPVHAEAVTNITSRGEMLMSIFFCLAFISFASNVPPKKTGPVSSTIGIYIIPWMGMGLSMFSKEQGATTLISIVIYDFMAHHESLQAYFIKIWNKDTAAIAFLRRSVILAVQTLILALFRKYLNGETSPDFIFDQNPAGFSEDRFTRVFSVSWVYCLYIYDAVYPLFLSPDWSGLSIDLIQDGSDARIWSVLLLWSSAAYAVYSLIIGPPTDASKNFKDTRRVMIMGFLAFLFSPFLLSSNLLVVVGLMKADRVIYLPLLGFFIMEVQLFKALFGMRLVNERKIDPVGEVVETTLPLAPSFTKKIGAHWLGYILIMCQIYFLTSIQHARNIAWSHSLNLWTAAYKVNPRSHHTMYNCGYELSIKNRFEEAEQVMRPIGSARVDGPSNTFVYAMVLHRLNRSDDAMLYIDEALQVLEEKLQAGGPRNHPHMLSRTKSNLLVAKAHCTEDMTQKGRIMYEAVQADQRNDYAIGEANKLMERIELMKKYQM
jgi:protein O-mannosyl-transferase